MKTTKIRVRVNAQCEICGEDFFSEHWVGDFSPWKSLWQTLSLAWAGDAGVLCCGKKCADSYHKEEAQMRRIEI